MSNIIDFPAIKRAISEIKALKQVDIEYIQQAILDVEALEVHIVYLPPDEIPEELQHAMISALTDYEMAVKKILEWAKSRDPTAFKGNFEGVRRGAG